MAPLTTEIKITVDKEFVEAIKMLAAAMTPPTVSLESTVHECEQLSNASDCRTLVLASDFEEQQKPAEVKAADSTDALTLDDIKTKSCEFLKQDKDNRIKLSDALKVFKLDTVNDLKPDQYSAFLAEAGIS